MRQIRKRDIRRNRQIAEKERGGSSQLAKVVEPTTAPRRAPAGIDRRATEPEPRSGEILASMQMRDRIASLIAQEAVRLDGVFGRDDEIETLRDLEEQVRALPPSPASVTGEVQDLITEVAISITYALEATEGMPLASRVEEMARAALFLPSLIGPQG